jgi:putative peptide zinc metalloprotease protein
VSTSAETIGPAVAPGGLQPVRPSGAEPNGAAAAHAAAAPHGRADPVPRRAAGVELLGEVAGSGYRRAPALVRRTDGQTAQLTPLLFHLLEAIDGRRGHAELAATLSERIGKLATADDVRFLIEAKLRPLGLLQHPDGAEPRLEKTNPLLALRLKLVVSNPEVTRRIAAPFAALFYPPVVVAATIAFALTTWWVGFEKGLASAAHQAIYEPSLLLLVFALTLLSAGFHELGHAAACRYGGARPGAMGVGLYLVWPAFYTDVTDSYRLRRGSRLRVDLGGLYFNAIFGVGILALWTAVRWDALLLVIAAQLVQMARQLVPIMRFDGYHILADLTGVPDLFSHIKPTLLGLLPTRWGRAEGKALKPWARAVVTGWVLAVVPLLATLLVLIVLVLPRIVATAWDSLGLHWQAVETHWAQTNASAVVLGLLSMLVIALPAVGIPYLLLRVARRTSQWAWRATAGRPPLRVAAAVAGVVVGAAVAWAWWPDDRYRPIDPDEDLGLWSVPGLMADRDRAPEPPVVRLAPALATMQASPAAGTMREPTGTAAQRRLMLVLLPKAAAKSGRVVVAPSVVPPASPSAPGSETGEVEPVPSVPSEPPPEAGAGSGEVAAEATAVPFDPPPAADVDARPDDGGAPAPTRSWPFPFVPPRESQEGDNQVVVVNTSDGSTAFDMALALVWVTDGGPVEQRNEAWALARCSDCRTVAVAFQVVLVVGYAQVVTPVDAAVAVNYECEACVTHALAVQLVATLTRRPGEQAMRELADSWRLLEQASESFETLPLEQVHEQLLAVRTLILEILERDGAVDARAADESAERADGEAIDASVSADHVATSDEDPDESVAEAAVLAEGTSSSVTPATGTEEPGRIGDTTGTAPDEATSDEAAGDASPATDETDGDAADDVEANEDEPGKDEAGEGERGGDETTSSTATP